MIEHKRTEYTLQFFSQAQNPKTTYSTERKKQSAWKATKTAYNRRLNIPEILKTK
jgi:hypothetical protein